MGGECSDKDFTEEQLKEMFTKFTEEMYKKVGTNIVKGSLVKPDPKPKKSKCNLLKELNHWFTWNKIRINIININLYLFHYLIAIIQIINNNSWVNKYSLLIIKGIFF